VNLFFKTISGISKKICQIGKIKSSLVVNDVLRSLSFRWPKRKKSFGARSDLSQNVDATFFGLLRIQSFLKKIADCEPVHWQNAKESFSMFFCGSMSRCFVGYLE
jgi:hypothetical protein